MDHNQTQDVFSSYHPINHLLFFTIVLIFTMIFMHPVGLFISLLSSLSYFTYLKGKQALLKHLAFLLPIIILSASLNPLFNHAGVHILMYLPSGNPLTLESILYGFASAMLLASLLTWFSVLNLIVTSDEIVYLFGKVAPHFALVLTMTLRFVPKFKNQLLSVAATQKVLEINQSNSPIKKIKRGMQTLSIVVMWSFEDAIDTANSMKARGYGLDKRSHFSIFSFKKRDKRFLSGFIILTLPLLISIYTKHTSWYYFPNVQAFNLNATQISLWLMYLTLTLSPLMLNLEMEMKWKRSQLKI